MAPIFKDAANDGRQFFNIIMNLIGIFDKFWFLTELQSNKTPYLLGLGLGLK